MMDIFPIKFRSPPPKPPRRRQLSSSSVFPSTRKKYYAKSRSNIDNQQENSCGSLPSNWTSDFTLEEKTDKSSMFKKECYSSLIENNSNISMDNTVENYKNCLDITLFENNDHLNCSSHKPSYIHRLRNSGVVANCNKKDIFKFINDCSNFNIKNTQNVQNSKSYVMKNLHKEHHRRHFSDPLPFNIENNTLSLSSGLFDISLNEHRKSKSLQVEIEALKDMNNKLWEHLRSLEAALDMYRKNSVETSVSSPSDILSSIYSSLRAKENAMEDRMKVVLQERDDVLKDLNNMVQVLAKSFKDCHLYEERSTDQEIKELLAEIELTNSPYKLLQQQRLLLSHLYRSKELQQDYLFHELKVISNERDNLLSKVKLLEKELNSLKLSNEIKNTDNKFWENSLLNALCQVIQQRDVAVKNCNKHNNLDYLTSRNSLHEKFSESDVISDGLQTKDGESIKKKQFQSSQNEKKKIFSINVKSKSEEARYLKEEILILHKSLEIEKEKREYAEEKNITLERLVNVLQKKLNGHNVGIPV